MIRLECVELEVGGRVLLATTTLEIASGDRLAIVGASGAGKSTLLRLVLGLASPTRGRVLAFGTPVTRVTSRAIRLRMGYVPQDGGLFPHLSVRENATIVAASLGWPEARVEQRLAELAPLVGVSADLWARFPFQLSGGQRQRVGLMRALMLDPEALLLDEPFAALDLLSASRLEDDLLAIIRRLKKTLLFVTHDIAQAGRIGDEVAVIHDGRVLQRGAFDVLASRPAHPYVTELLDACRSSPRSAPAGAT